MTQPVGLGTPPSLARRVLLFQLVHPTLHHILEVDPGTTVLAARTQRKGNTGLQVCNSITGGSSTLPDMFAERRRRDSWRRIARGQ